MKSNKLLSLTSALILCIGLAGCGNTGSEDSGRSTKTTAAPTEAVKADTAEAADAQTEKAKAEPTGTTATASEKVKAVVAETASEQTAPDSGGGYHIVEQPVIDSPEWVTALEATKDCEQLIVVAGIDKSTAFISMHEKSSDGRWQQIISSPGFVGLEGLGEANCRQTITPVGTFTIDKAFGLADDPGGQMEYTKCDGDWYWSGDAREGMHFNELVNINDVPGLDPEECERITDYEYPYQYCLNMGWNSENDPEKGCAFFFHCHGTAKPYTGGCVSVNEPVMKFIMQHVKPGCKITIDTIENLHGEI